MSRVLVSLYDRIFLLRQSFMPALNDMLLGLLLYRLRLMPGAPALIGIAEAFTLIVGYLVVMFSLIGPHDPLAGLSALLVALLEFSLGIYLCCEGIQPCSYYR